MGEEGEGEGGIFTTSGGSSKNFVCICVAVGVYSSYMALYLHNVCSSRHCKYCVYKWLLKQPSKTGNVSY